MISPLPVSPRIDPRNPPAYLCTAVERLQAAFGDRLVGVALYGSRARGDAHPHSDVDLLVLVRGLPVHWQERTTALQTPLRGITLDFDFSVYGSTPEEFEQFFPSIYLDMGLDGIVLYDTDHYLTRKLEQIRAIIQETRLRRLRLSPDSMFWDWDKAPQHGWELDWEGYRELA